ncbi:cuticle protein 18.6-like [Pieris napi]|uniref:cuticle protein 18.6-like n=1 Tax=Pieris napi TaxID=78633 RepID=UPI001FB90FA0|nr:cuticle protein 18.6-like [Pieris napi]
MNSYLAVSCFLAIVAAAFANPHGLGLIPVHSVESIPNPNYSFNYAVNDPSTGDNKAQWEARNGDQVRGAYSLVEPDGNVRTVEYTADALRGFNAVVRKSGPNINSVAVAAPAIIQAPAIVEPAPVIEQVQEVAPVAQVYETPILDHGPIFDHGPILAPAAPLLNHGPLPAHGPLLPSYGLTAPLAPLAPAPIAPAQILDYFPLIHSAQAPVVSVSGTSYGRNGHVAQRWVAGPLTHGQSLTIRTRH